MNRVAMNSMRQAARLSVAASIFGGVALCQGEEDQSATKAEGQEALESKLDHLEAWHKRWTSAVDANTNPGWHVQDVNPNLVKYKEHMMSEDGECNFFVPLCGKTVDLVWLAQFGFVAGVEIAQEAIDQFAEEHKLEWDGEALEKSDKKLYRASAPGSENHVAIGKMDLFNLPHGWSDLGESGHNKFTHIWDRASLVAIDPDMRKQYVETMVQQTTPDATVLLCTFEYPEGVRPGPPHSVTEDIVRELFDPHFTVELLERHEAPMPETSEAVYLMKKR
mmetsp:Transcript_22267/g.39409  ORF Transcript_22267/g.39409 Transcript_22267/m.39409 type:complete len:278 (-) Transcript_22267:488-1321(-)